MDQECQCKKQEGYTQLLGLILAWGYVVRIACLKNHESMLREFCIIAILAHMGGNLRVLDNIPVDDKCCIYGIDGYI
ncbi:MAG: hypothetical protein U9Q84_09845 [Thermodesulfobacteriota bacterium]|nr:hypothetical protein [Thermodesulfobacteriota bacterium]